MSILTTAGITFGDSTSQTTAAVAGVTSLNSQTGAITNTSSGAIGSFFCGLSNSGTTYTPTSTRAGSSLRGGGAESMTTPSQSLSANPSYSGTWRTIGYGSTTVTCPCSGNTSYWTAIFVRVS